MKQNDKGYIIRREKSILNKDIWKMEFSRLIGERKLQEMLFGK